MRNTVADGLELALLFAMPAACGLVVLGEPIIGLIYEHGRFTPSDTQQAAVALMGYAVGLAGYAGVKVLVPAFYALGDVRTPMRVSAVSIFVNFALNWTLVRKLGFGHLGLALSTSGVAVTNFVWLGWLLRGRLQGIEGRRLLATLPRIATAAIVMAVAVWLGDAWLSASVGFSGESPWRLYVVRVSLGIVLGLGTFVGCCWGLRLRLPVFSAVWRRWPRRERGSPKE